MREHLHRYDVPVHVHCGVGDIHINEEFKMNFDRLDLRPLQHRFDAGAEPMLFAVAPHFSNVLVEILVFFEMRAL